MKTDLKRVLLVEDDRDIREITSLALGSLGGLEVIACACGAEAIAEAPHARADLIILDVMMPGMDGPATLKALREIPQTRSTPAIFMTAKVQEAEVRRFKALGAVDVIGKPFSVMQLAGRIREIWREALKAAA